MTHHNLDVEMIWNYFPFSFVIPWDAQLVLNILIFPVYFLLWWHPLYWNLVPGSILVFLVILIWIPFFIANIVFTSVGIVFITSAAILFGVPTIIILSIPLVLILTFIVLTLGIYVTALLSPFIIGASFVGFILFVFIGIPLLLVFGTFLFILADILLVPCIFLAIFLFFPFILFAAGITAIVLAIIFAIDEAETGKTQEESWLEVRDWFILTGETIEQGFINFETVTDVFLQEATSTTSVAA
jgi:hypothetical protein